MRGTAWAFALCFAAITVVSWRYLFILPIVFSIVITVGLTAAAWLSAEDKLNFGWEATGPILGGSSATRK
jgi:MFS superfamily sulfate permease-like transporter